MPKHILIINNDPDVLDILREILIYEGYVVTTAEQTSDIISGSKKST
jgi:DNA-binding response OmpR family regulator